MDHPPPTPRQTAAAERETRRATELRENLRKRKMQAAERDTSLARLREKVPAQRAGEGT